MERLLFAFALIGIALACQSVPRPGPGAKHGHDTAYVTIVTNQVYDLSKVAQYMGYFPQTKIQEYSAPLGVFSNLGNTDSNRYFAFTFTLKQCNCDEVRTWVNQIVASSNYYTSGNVVCSPGGPVIIEAPPAPPTTTAAPTKPNDTLLILNEKNGQTGPVGQPPAVDQVDQVAPVGQVAQIDVKSQHVPASAAEVVAQQPVLAEQPVLHEETI
uniref:Conserved secreted protein n=1 Tax=Haemonchus contortus TaxID=6289 RepID=A0A7I4YFV8_HAECO|nr:unnamed protein product [Haemonchus contortus]